MGSRGGVEGRGRSQAEARTSAGSDLQKGLVVALIVAFGVAVVRLISLGVVLAGLVAI